MNDRILKIIESFTLSKTGDPDGGEDALFIGKNYIAVIDGATSKNEWYKKPKRAIDCQLTPGTIAKLAILEALGSAPSFDHPWPLLNILNNAVATTTSAASYASQASIIIYSLDAREVWSYGDCLCCINGELFLNTKDSDIHLATVRSHVLHQALKNGVSLDKLRREDIGRDAIQKDLKRNALLGNAHVPDGYPVLNGKALNRELLRIYPVLPRSEVILASDGYPTLYPTLFESENHLSNTIQSDPLMIDSHPQTKGVYENQVSFDDRTYIRFLTGDN